jgi:hypothetical protein
MKTKNRKSKRRANSPNVDQLKNRSVDRRRVDGIRKAPHPQGFFSSVYLPMPDPGPVGANVDPLGEALGPSVLPDGLWVLFGLAGPRGLEPGALPVVVPLVDEPVVVPLAAGLPAAELPPAEPVPLCASANVLESANAAASAIVASFMIVSLALLTKDNSSPMSYVPTIFGAMKAARASVFTRRTLSSIARHSCRKFRLRSRDCSSL